MIKIPHNKPAATPADSETLCYIDNYIYCNDGSIKAILVRLLDGVVGAYDLRNGRGLPKDNIQEYCE